MPVYNVEKYVEDALASILNQTYDNLEIIVIDDGSVDRTLDEVSKIADNDDRVIVLKNEENKKIVYSLNRGLSVASGEYIARMDGDDIAAPDRIEQQVSFLVNHPDFDLIGTSFFNIDEDGNVLGRSKRFTDPELIEKTLLLASPVAHSWLCRREVYDALGGYRDLPYAEDYDFLLRMKTYGFKFTNIDIDGTFMRIRRGSTATAHGLVQRKMVNHIVELYKERLKYGNDSFSKVEFERISRSGKWLGELHSLSSLLLNKAVANRETNFLASLVCLVLAGLLSPYQAQYLFRRALLRFHVWRS